MSLITPHLIVILIVLCICCLVFNFFKTRQIKNDPLLTEEAVVHAKPFKTNRFDSLFTMEFRIVGRDTVIACKVPYDVWNLLEEGQKGMLTHKSGFLHSFESNGATYSATYNSGVPV